MWDFILRITTDRNIITYCYVLPLIVSVVFHCIDYVKMYRNEKAEYEKAIQLNTNFYPSLTIGNIVGGFFLSAIPVVNILYCTFGVFPDLIGGVFSRIGKTLNIHLVPSHHSSKLPKG